MEFISTSTNTHIYTIIILMFIMAFNLFSVLKADNFISLTNRLKFMTPLFHTSNAIVAYTGAIIAAFSHDLSITVILMIAATIYIMILEIKRYKKMRIIKANDLEKQNEFRIFAKKIYTTQIAVLVITYLLSKVF